MAICSNSRWYTGVPLGCRRLVILYSQHPLTQPQLDIGFISLISKLTLDIGVAGFLFNSHIPPTTLTLDIVMAGFILFVRLSQQFGGGPPKPSCYALPGLGWTGLRVFANYSILEYWQPRCRGKPTTVYCTRIQYSFSKDLKGNCGNAARTAGSAENCF